ncbi:MAG TPA: S53 family peptidase [Amnibacterium sp.]|uniref:S53 family peptidase n=1 Tax=Amnibacterium sp. TaxID=1872496 RepID=UPI002F94BBDB
MLLGGTVLALLMTAGPVAAQAAQNWPARSAGHVHVCGTPAHGAAACNAIRADPVSNNGTVQPNVTPSGYGPADLRSAYKLTATGTSSQTVAIVDAYDDPKAEADLATYRAQYGLPACTTANGCFTKVGQTGSKTSLPRADGGWTQEISLDLDMVSAICPGCKILLVEASSSSLTNLGTAVNTAARLGATEISNSYGGSESPSDTAYDWKYYSHPGVAITASSGDNGYGVEYPAASANVTAVGGTSLAKSSTTRGWSETAWNGAGSGCSAYDPKISGQSSVSTGCAKRAVADVSAVADPNTGVAVYDSYTYQGAAGWMVFGGTSVASPVIASVYALAGGVSASTTNSSLYSNANGLFDVTSGSNGTCTTKVLCTAGTGWDGPTGLGTPNGTAAF